MGGVIVMEVVYRRGPLTTEPSLMIHHLASCRQAGATLRIMKLFAAGTAWLHVLILKAFGDLRAAHNQLGDHKTGAISTGSHSRNEQKG